MNGLSSLFETYFTMLNQKARNENKFPNLQTFLLNLENKEYYIK